MSYPANQPGGQIWFQAIFDGGPSIGKVRRPVFNDRIITAAGNVNVEPYDYLILVKKTVGAATTVFLPLVSLWMRQPYGMTPLLIKDGKGDSDVNPITLTPAGSDLIDGLASWQLAGPYSAVQLRPLSDLTGWSVL